MTCQSCVDDITKILKGFTGMFEEELLSVSLLRGINWHSPDIKSFDIDLNDQRVVVEGSGMHIVFYAIGKINFSS